MGNGEVDGLVVADLEMEIGALLDPAPIAAVKRVGADEVERTGDISSGLLGEDEQDLIGHGLAKQAETLPREIGRAPFARPRVHVEGKEGVEMRLGESAPRHPFDVDAVAKCFAALFADRLPLARVEAP